MYLCAAANYSAGCPSPGPLGLASYRSTRRGGPRNGLGLVEWLGSWWGVNGISTGDAVADWAAWRKINPGADPLATLAKCDSGAYYITSPCWSLPRDEWHQITNATTVATPRPPTGAELAAAAGGGEQALVQKLVNEQMTAQQKLNASQVVPVWQPVPEVLVNADEAISDAAKKAIGWAPWLGLLVAGFAMVAVGAGSPRRYGR